jgi:Trypsin-like peptidase domain
MAWHQVYDKIKPSIVKILTEDGFGTGFLFGYNKDHSIAAIATAAHVISDAFDWRQPIKISHYESKEIAFLEHHERVIWLDRTRDAATVLITSKSLPLPATPLPLIDATKFKKMGIEVGWTGFPGLAPEHLCFFSGRISFFVQELDSYLIDGVAINGVSGGPVFDESKDSIPQIIGVVSAYMANRRASETLPGLLQAQDLTSFHQDLKKIRSLDEAKEKEQETQKQVDEKSNVQSSPSTTPVPPPPSVPAAGNP